MQETFLRLWKHGLTGEVIFNVRGWLLRVVRNLAEDQAKSSFGITVRNLRKPWIGLPRCPIAAGNSGSS